MNTMPFASQKMMPPSFLQRRRPLPSLEGVRQGASTSLIVFWSLAQNGGPDTHPE